MSAIDRIKNSLENVMGKGKEVTGEASGDHSLKAEGVKDQKSASLKNAGESVKDAGGSVKDAVQK